MTHDNHWVPLSLASLVDRSVDTLTTIEGVFLTAAGSDETISPQGITSKTSIDVQTAIDVMRQVEQTNAVELASFQDSIRESQFLAKATPCRELFTAARHAAKAIRFHEQQSSPQPTVTPLVTFPDDPALAELSAMDLQMSWLMSELTIQIKRASESIVILSPFFEREGFERLTDVLLDSLKRGVELTIVSRYVRDEESYNREVLAEFTKRVESTNVDDRQLQIVDYTVWGQSVPPKDQTQSGALPAFTLHAKVMLFDTEAAYVGSANVTDYGFDRYLETGVLIEGPPVMSYVSLVKQLLDSPQSVEVEL